MTTNSSNDSDHRKDIPRRQALGYLGAALGGALLGGTVAQALQPTQQPHNQEQGNQERDMTDNHEGQFINISAEQAREIKEQSALFAKSAFMRDGFSGKRQSDTLTVAQWNPTTRMSLDLTFEPGAHPDILDVTADDLAAVTISYATNDLAIGKGEGDHPEGTIPPISTDGSANIAFRVNLQAYPVKEPRDPLGTTYPAQQRPSEPEYFLEIQGQEVKDVDTYNRMPYKIPPIGDMINSAFAQFEQ